MRKDQKVKENTFNIFMIIIFIFGSANLGMLFWRPNPIENIETKITKQQQYYMASNEGKENITSVDKIDIQKVLTAVYVREKSYEAGSYTEDEINKQILSNKLFFENGQFSKKKFAAFLAKMSSVLKIKITTHDYVKFLQLHATQRDFESMMRFVIKECPVDELMIKNLSFEEKEITGTKIIPEIVTTSKRKFTKKEIAEFIKAEKYKKIITYTVPEKRSGFILKVKLDGIASKIVDAINYYLKHQSFDKEKLEKFLIQFAKDSNNFTSTLNIEYKNSLEKSCTLNKTKEDFALSEHFTVEEYSHVEQNETTNLLFDKNYGKYFNFLGDIYCKVIVTEVIKKKDREITEEFLNTFVMPSLQAFTQQTLILKACYDVSIAHNNKTQPCNINGISITFNSQEKEILQYASIGDAFVLEDTHGNPYIFIVTSIRSKPSKLNIQKDMLSRFFTTKYNEFITGQIFFSIFEICYNKLKKKMDF